MPLQAMVDAVTGRARRAAAVALAVVGALAGLRAGVARAAVTLALFVALGAGACAGAARAADWTPGIPVAAGGADVGVGGAAIDEAGALAVAGASQDAARTLSGGVLRPGAAIVALPLGDHVDGERIVFDGGGAAVLAWVDTSTRLVHAARLEAGATTWTPLPDVAGAVSAADVGVDAAGTVTVAYVDDGPSSTYEVHARMLARGASVWSGADTIVTGAAVLPTGFTLAEGPTGTSIVTWAQYTAAPASSIWAAVRRDAGASWAMGHAIDAMSGTGLARPRGAVGPGGEVAATWLAAAGGAPTVDFSKYNDVLTDAWDPMPHEYLAAGGEGSPSASAVTFAADGTMLGVIGLDGDGPLRMLAVAPHTAWAAPQAIDSSAAVQGPRQLDVAASATGAVVVTFVSVGDPHLYGLTRAPGSTAFAERELTTFDPGSAVPVADRAGDVALLLARTATGAAGFSAVVYDAAPPVLSAAVLPTATVAGDTVHYAVAAGDRFSPVAVGWAFGDGATAAGLAPDHVFTAPGSYDVTATATDGAGNTAAVSGAVAVGTLPLPPAPEVPVPAPAVPAVPVTPAPVTPPAVLAPKTPAASRTKTTSFKAGDGTLALSTPAGCVKLGSSISVTLAFKASKKKGALYVKLTRVDFSIAGHAPRRDTKSPFRQTLKLQTTAATTVTLRARATIKVRHGRPPTKSVSVRLKLCR